MIELQHITKVYNRGEVNEVTALNDVSLTIPKGEFVVVIGTNGSGKSTLFNTIAGADTPSSGKVLIDGKDVTKTAEYKRSQWIARVFQNPLSGTAPDLSIIDNFRLASLRTTSKRLVIGVNETFKKTVRDKIATLGMGLENKTEQQMGSLSGGQRQALTLLMSVMDKTDILLLDEPTAALDPRSANTVLTTADKLIKEYNLTAILITHNLKDAYQYGTRLVQMNEGKIIRDLGAGDKAALKQSDLFEWFA